ncbi:MAG: hypothetical protein LBT60_07320 [Oscillospiraceae bacterium]|jgi:hypothetical protein|nr:hypothetical protein [Oscillospiraceae bacterium]
MDARRTLFAYRRLYGLPALNVVEGLLTGNINSLKLPSREGGLSVRLLRALFGIEPSLAEYVYVFDYASKDLVNMGKMAALADTRIIEWGHKVSFAYVTPEGATPQALQGLARHIVQTGQLLCGSCQGLLFDTEDREALYALCETLLPLLEAEAAHWRDAIDLGARAPRRAGAALTPAIQLGHAWARRLPRAKLLETLRPYKNHLQTAGLLCAPADRAPLTDRLWRADVVRVTGDMSDGFCGEAHDGDYPLRRYTKVVSGW